jgi:hypothetical protein
MNGSKYKSQTYKITIDEWKVKTFSNLGDV